VNDPDLLTFVTDYPDLFGLLKYGIGRWRATKRHECYTYVLSINMAIECLACNFAGYGEIYPEAKPKADEIIDRFFAENRTRLLDFYLPNRANIEDRLREAWRARSLELNKSSDSPGLLNQRHSSSEQSTGLPPARTQARYSQG
jgi:hypothetical protein